MCMVGKCHHRKCRSDFHFRFISPGLFRPVYFVCNSSINATSSNPSRACPVRSTNQCEAFIFICLTLSQSMNCRLECQASKREIVGSSLALDKNFSFFNTRFLRVAHSSYQSIQMKSTVTYT